MAYNTTAELQKMYFSNSQYAVDQPSNMKAYDSLLQWPSNGYFDRFKPDADLLQKAILPADKSGSYSIADQVFGNQKQLAYLGLRHLANLFYERCQLHKQHLREINGSHMQIQEKRFCTEINHTPENAKRLSNLEGQLLQLEQQRRDEEFTFWKDTSELREKLFENAALYKTAKQRYSVFSDVEANYDR